MAIVEQMAVLKSEMNSLIETAKKAERDLTAEEAEEINAKAEQYKELQERSKKAQDAVAFVASIGGSEKSPEDLGGETKSRSVGERLVKSHDFAEFAKKGFSAGDLNGKNIHLSAPNVGSALEVIGGRKANITTGTGQIPRVQETGYRNYLPVDEGLDFLDLITTAETTVPYGEYAQVISETDNADIVPEGELKPESDLTTNKVPSNPFTYADGFTITNQTLADDGALAAFMEGRIRRHLAGAIERYVLNGSGEGTQPRGILATTGTLYQAFNEDVIVTLARSLERFETANGDLNPQAIVMNRADVWAMRLMKDNDGKYLFGNPFEQGPIPTPWGVPLVPSSKVTSGTALVGRFDSFHFLALDPVSVVAFNQHKDYAQRNLVYVRAETRGRQLFYSPREVVVAEIAAPVGG